MLDGGSHPTLPGPAARDLARRRRTFAIAATVAAALHVAVLVPLLWVGVAPQPPDSSATVELTPMPVAATAPAAPDQPATESTSSVAPPDAARPVDAPAATAAAPPDAAPPVPPPDAATAVAPEPVPSLASSEPPTGMEAPAELLHAAQPPDAIEAASPPAAPLPRPPPVPLPRPAPRPVVRPTPRREAVAAAEPTAPAAAPAPLSAPAPAPPAPSPPSNAVPTWRGELVGRLQRAKRYPDAARSRSEQGIATVTFTLDRAGRVVSAALVASSGSTALDQETLALVRRAEPLPAPPPEIPGATVTLTIPVTFTLR